MIDPRKELGPLLKLCRKFGVTELTIEGVSIKFGDLPLRKMSHDGSDEPPTDELSPDELMFFSAPSAEGG